MPQRLAVGQFVEGGVGEGPLAGSEFTQDPGGALAQPVQGGGRALAACQIVIEALQGRADRAAGAGEQVTELFPEPARLAMPEDDASFLPATGAGAPEFRAGDGAGRAERRAGGAAADGGHGAAPGAAGPALLAGPAPGLACGLGDDAWRFPPADGAGQCLPGAASRAERPVRSADADPPLPAAPGAFLEVGRIADQAAGADRLAVPVADGGLSHSAAAGALLGPGPGHAVAAAPQPVYPPVKLHDTVTAPACRADDVLRAGELVDQPQHAHDRGPGSAAGEQARVPLDGPGEFPQVSCLGEHALGCRGDRVRRQRGVRCGDSGGEDGERVAVVPVRAPGAARLSFPVTAGDERFPAAGGAAAVPAGASAAVPVLAEPRERAQMLSAARAGRRGDHRGAGLAQREQQVAGDPRRG